MENGIYFNLPEVVYFAEQRLDFTGISALLKSPTEYWFSSRLNPLFEEKKTPAFFEGKIYHTLILEPDEFANRYVVEPDSVAKMSRKSSAYWAWAQGQKKQIIKADLAEKIANSLLYLGNPGQVLDSEIFKQGHPEVSILFEYRGVACKARIDYLKSIQMWDLKTVCAQGQNFSDWCKKYFFKYKTFIQLCFYREAARAAKGFTEKQVFGTPPQLEFWKDWREIEDILPGVVFINKNCPQAEVKLFDDEHCPDMYRLARGQIEKGIEIFKNYLNEYGYNKAWLDKVDVRNLFFKDEDFPQSFAELLTILGENE